MRDKASSKWLAVRPPPPAPLQLTHRHTAEEVLPPFGSHPADADQHLSHAPRGDLQKSPASRQPFVVPVTTRERIRPVPVPGSAYLS